MTKDLIITIIISCSVGLNVIAAYVLFNQNKTINAAKTRINDASEVAVLMRDISGCAFQRVGYLQGSRDTPDNKLSDDLNACIAIGLKRQICRIKKDS